MKIGVLSGKGGTGKTLVATSLASSLPGVGFGDCDVEAPNGHLLLNPKVKQTMPVSVLIPEISYEKCDNCGLCAQICAYRCLLVPKKGPVIFMREMCHSCGGCALVCPTGAIVEKDLVMGQVFIGDFDKKPMVWGLLNIKEGRSTPIIDQIHSLTDDGKNWIIDCPPGTTCPAVAAARGCDVALLVAEPSLAGAHDLKMSIMMLKSLNKPAAILINKSGLEGADIRAIGEEYGLPVLMELPYSPEIAQIYASGRRLTDVKTALKDQFLELGRVLLTMGKL